MNKTIAKIFAAIFAVALITSQFWSCSTAQLLSSGQTTEVVEDSKGSKSDIAQPTTGVKFVLKVDVSEKFLNLTPEKEENFFQKAYQLAKEKQQGSKTDFISLFAEAYEQVAPGELFAKYFLNTPEVQNQIQITSSNEETLTIIREIIKGYVEDTHKVLKRRVDSLGLDYTAVLLDEQSNTITIKIGAEQDLKRFKNYLTARGALEFWDTYSNAEVYDELVRLHDELKRRGVDDNGDSVLLFKLLTPIMPDDDGSRIARIGEAEADNVNKTTALLTGKEAQNILPQGLRFVWDVRESFILGDSKVYKSLYALNTQDRGPPCLTGEQIERATVGFDDANKAVVTIEMDEYGTKVWKEMTERNVGRFIAMVFDGQAYSVPRVMEKIVGGKTQISGEFENLEEAKKFANLLTVGKLPCPVLLLEETIW